MKYRVMAVLTFNTEKEAREFWKVVKLLQLIGLNNSDDAANIHKCFHDETPSKPCEIIDFFANLKPVPIQ